MQTALKKAVEGKIEKATGKSAAIKDDRSQGGGCINNACVISLTDGRKYFLKSNPSPLPHMFPREAEGLQAMAESETIRVPRPIGTGGESAEDRKKGIPPYIVMENIKSGSPKKGFYKTFGRQFAEMHLKTKQERFGFNHDNYIGATPQPNQWTDDWIEFWREQRLGFQLELARKNGLSDSSMNRLGDAMLDRLDDLIGDPDEPACLLHGDLWGGNYMTGENSEPVLIDPAAYYGCREADLAMTLCFGRFDPDFYSAYNETWPLESGSDQRLEIYKLYHLLNHLNLFGSSYYGGCISILKQFGS